MSDNNTQARKDLVVDFLKLAVAGRIDEAYRKHIDMTGKHHNPYFAAGFPALKQAMIDNHAKYPDKRIDIKRVITDGDTIATHSHVSLNPGNLNVAVVHIFRFQGDRIAELWDIAQEMKADSPNADGII